MELILSLQQSRASPVTQVCVFADLQQCAGRPLCSVDIAPADQIKEASWVAHAPAFPPLCSLIHAHQHTSPAALCAYSSTHTHTLSLSEQSGFTLPADLHRAQDFLTRVLCFTPTSRITNSPHCYLSLGHWRNCYKTLFHPHVKLLKSTTCKIFIIKYSKTTCTVLYISCSCVLIPYVIPKVPKDL